MYKNVLTALNIVLNAYMHYIDIVLANVFVFNIFRLILLYAVIYCMQGGGFTVRQYQAV